MARVFFTDRQRTDGIVTIRFGKDNYPQNDEEMKSFLQAFVHHIYRVNEQGQQMQCCVHVDVDSVPREFIMRQKNALIAFIREHRDASRQHIRYTLFYTQSRWVQYTMQLIFALSKPAAPYAFVSTEAAGEAYWRASQRPG